MGTLEVFNTSEWAYSEDPDRQRDFVRLLNECLRRKAWKLNLRFSKDHGCYYVRATPDLSVRRYRYRNVVNETSRTVFRGYAARKGSSEISYYRHSAFKGFFVRYDGTWYLEITPTYYFTWNGRDPDKFYEDRLKGIKQREKNQALLGQIIMWAEYLTQGMDLFTASYSFLEFDRLKRFDINWGIPDDLWLPKEDEETRMELLAAEPLLFD